VGGVFGGGGGGGSPPSPPKLKQVDTSLGGPLWTTAANAGQQWANLMRGSYGLQPATAAAPASWEAKYLGPGALALMGQAQRPFVGQQDPQVQGALKTAFGRGYNLGSDPYQMAQQLGQQFRAPLGQLERNQQFATSLLKQWQPPNLTLTGEDLLNVKMQQMAQNQRAQQQALEAAMGASNVAAQQQAAASAAGIGALGKVGQSAISSLTSPTLQSGGYYQSPLGLLFGGGGGLPSGATDTFSGDVYGAGTDVSSALGPSMEGAYGGGGGSTFGS